MLNPALKIMLIKLKYLICQRLIKCEQLLPILLVGDYSGPNFLKDSLTIYVHILWSSMLQMYSHKLLIYTKRYIYMHVHCNIVCDINKPIGNKSKWLSVRN